MQEQIKAKAKVIGVIAAMQIELDAIRELMQESTEEWHGKLLFTRGKINDKDLVIADSGIGPVNAAIVTEKLISTYGVDCILHTGIAGGLAEDLDVQSVILGESLMYHDFDASILEQFSPYQSSFHSDIELLNLAKEAIPNDLNMRVGKIVSGNRFVSDSSLRKIIVDTVGGLCVDMESSAVAHTATVNNIPFLVIRCVSDLADDDAEDTYEANKSMSARVAASVVSAIVAIH